MTRNTAKSHNNTRMLNSVIAVIKLRSNRTYVIALSKHKHLLKPVGCYNFNIIIKQQHILAI